MASLGDQLFGGDHPRLLLSGNAGHADIPLDAPGSGLMGTLMSMLGQTVGFPVPAGGAGGVQRDVRMAGVAGQQQPWVVAVEELIAQGRHRRQQGLDDVEPTRAA